jgi:predicted RNA-binding Zn-ribbon protein involved in translation (DUF1610 family)
MWSYCPDCGVEAVSLDDGQWLCDNPEHGVFDARVCPECWELGVEFDADGWGWCGAEQPHLFHPAEAICENCHHGVPAIREDADAWICPACGAWEQDRSEGR